MAFASCVSIHCSARTVISRKASPSKPATALTGVKLGCIRLRPLVKKPRSSPFHKIAGLPSLSPASAKSLSSAIATSLAFCLNIPAKCRSAAANSSFRSPAFAPGSTRNEKPCKVPISSPSTRTRLASSISTGKSAVSPPAFRKSMAVRLSTKRCRNASCKASESLASKARARSAMAAGLASQSTR